ncbi:hypothetical protein [Corynebacterium accolens]|uniref:hypothetical protein n=1 Tax=Corynebacterium accolens TaxID=38284 RepID=UPI00254CE448|nr:hypothetical protein [Corynebacterium accolens]MDK8469829.1 hypothetical protein [Corynebacterium accolens]
MKKLSLSGWKLVASLVGAFILGVAAMIGFAFAVGDDDSNSAITDDDAQRLSDIQRQFESTPSALPSDEAGNDESFNDGTFKVGADIQPGTYKNEGSESCYWARLSGFSGDSAEILSNDNPRGQTYVTIEASDVAFKSRNCGAWTKVES